MEMFGHILNQMNNMSKRGPKYSGMLISGIYIKRVIYNNPVTIIIWSDGSKTTCKCQEGDTYNPQAGFLICYLKKIAGSENVVRLIEEWGFKGKDVVTLTDVRKENRK